LTRVFSLINSVFCISPRLFAESKWRLSSCLKISVITSKTDALRFVLKKALLIEARKNGKRPVQI